MRITCNLSFLAPASRLCTWT